MGRYISGNEAGVDKRLISIIRTAAEASPYTVKITSGKRDYNPKTRTINHPGGFATDVQLSSDGGHTWHSQERTKAAAPPYQDFARYARAVQTSKYPELTGTFRWGGMFGGRWRQDNEHFDITPGHKGAMSQGTWASIIARHPVPPADIPDAGTPEAGGSVEAYIRQAATARGIDPDVAVRVAKSEGGLDDPLRQSDVGKKEGHRETSYGPFQLRINGGLGDEALRAGVDPRKDWQGGVDFALNYAAKNGWGSWYGAIKPGPKSGFTPISRTAGLDGAQPVAIGTATAYTGGPPQTAAQQAAAEMAAGPLRKGATDAKTGGAVTRLQQQLADRGFDLGPHGVDGRFGKDTAAAVRAAEKSYGLNLDRGVAGPQVQAALAYPREIALPRPRPPGGPGGPGAGLSAGMVPGGVLSPFPPGQASALEAAMAPNAPYGVQRGGISSGGPAQLSMPEGEAPLGWNARDPSGDWTRAPMQDITPQDPGRSSLTVADMNAEPGGAVLDARDRALANKYGNVPYAALPAATKLALNQAGLGERQYEVMRAGFGQQVAANVPLPRLRPSSAELPPAQVAQDPGGYPTAWGVQPPPVGPPGGQFIGGNGVPPTTPGGPIDPQTLALLNQRAGALAPAVGNVTGSPVQDRARGLALQTVLSGNKTGTPVMGYRGVGQPLPVAPLSPAGFLTAARAAGRDVRDTLFNASDAVNQGLAQVGDFFTGGPPTSTATPPPTSGQSIPPAVPPGGFGYGMGDGAGLSAPAYPGSVPQQGSLGGDPQVASAAPDFMPTVVPGSPTMSSAGIPQLVGDMTKHQGLFQGYPDAYGAQQSPSGLGGAQYAGFDGSDILRGSSGSSGADVVPSGGPVPSGGAGGYGGYDPLSSAYVPFQAEGAQLDPAGTPTNQTVDVRGGKDVLNAGRPAPGGMPGFVGYTNIGNGVVPTPAPPPSLLSRIAPTAGSILGNAVGGPGMGMFLSAIARSVARGSFDQTSPYRGQITTAQPYAAAAPNPYGGYTTGSSYSASRFTPAGSGWRAPNFNINPATGTGSGGPLYAYNPQTHTYIDSHGNEHPYD